MSLISHCHNLNKPLRTSYSVLRAVYIGNKSFYSTKPSPDAVGEDVHQNDSGVRCPIIKDVFSINSVDNKLVSGEYQEESDGKEERKSALVSLANSSRSKLANEPEEKLTAFGHIRLDSANKVKYHAQFDPNNKKPSLDFDVDLKPVGIKIPEKSGSQISYSHQELLSVEVDTIEVTSDKLDDGHDTEVIEDLNKYFPPTNNDLRSVKDHKRDSVGIYQFDLVRDILKSQSKALELSDEDYKESRHQRNERARAQWLTAKRSKENDERDLKASMIEAKESPLKAEEEIEKELSEIRREVEAKVEKYKERLLLEEEDDKEGQMTLVEAGQVASEGQVAEEEPKEKKPMSAFEYVQELRKKKRFAPEGQRSKTSGAKDADEPKNIMGAEVIPEMKLDSQGFNSFINYVTDLRMLRKDELLWMLKKRIIFNDLGLIAINKPHGLIVQGQMADRKVQNGLKDPNLVNLLPDFSKLLVHKKLLDKDKDGNVPKLRIVHRLDKETTGVLLLATSSKVAANISELLSKSLIEKHYYCITKDVPDQNEGIINIPIETGMIDGKERQVLRPELREELRRIASPSRDGHHAVTYYKVRTSHGNAALLEVVPETGVKHQIRVHLGFGLRCPILGDHKYTYLDKLVPQKLPNDMLKSLNVRPSKVRNIPIHLHCKLLIVPGFGKHGSNVMIHADLPGFFKKTIKMLKLSD